MTHENPGPPEPAATRSRPDGEGVAADENGISRGAAGSGSPDSPDQPRAKRDDGKSSGSFWRELPILVVIALVLALLIKAYAVQAFYIPSSSMENTLLIGDRVLVNKIVYHTRDIRRGDTVVFNGLDSWDPEVTFAEPTNPISRFFRGIGQAFGVAPGEKDYIKRVIGIPGDRVSCCDGRGRVSVNGVPLEESGYLYPGNKPSTQSFEVTVPRGRLWVMGDHRALSYDSRQHQQEEGGGTIPVDRVIGRAFVVVWPPSRIKTLPIPETFSQPGLALAGTALGATPLLLGFAGALPLTWAHRRWRRRRRGN